MADVKRPRHGSKQFWPRKRAKRPYSRVKAWASSKNISLLGFAGYKAGMTHIAFKDSRPNSQTKGESVVWPVTVIECPPIKIFSIRLYKNTPYGKRVVFEIFNPKLNKELTRKINVPKKQKFDEKLKEINSRIDQFDDLKACVYTQPLKTGIEKKRPEVFEMGLGGDGVKSKLDYVLSIFDKEIRVSDIFKPGVKVDVHAVTKGKGFQGVVKRFGVQLSSHKSEKSRRSSIKGPERPGKVIWGILMPGGMGYHLRTEYNKDVLLIGDDPKKINPKGGFLHYGLVKNDFVLLKGSIPGHIKRLITFTEPIRGSKGLGQNVQIQYISLESKQ